MCKVQLIQNILDKIDKATLLLPIDIIVDIVIRADLLPHIILHAKELNPLIKGGCPKTLYGKRLFFQPNIKEDFVLVTKWNKDNTMHCLTIEEQYLSFVRILILFLKRTEYLRCKK